MTATTWQGTSAARPPLALDRVIEVAAVLLLGIATVGSAWCAYQVSQWNGVETDEARISAAARIDASREYALATQKVSYDASVVATYAEAVIADDGELQEFVRATLIRPEFLPIVDQWQQQIAESGSLPGNLFENDAYLDSLFAESTALDAAAVEASIRGDEASENSEDYILTTLFMASALFFAGVTSSFSSRFAKIVLVGASALTIAFAASRLVGYPVA